MLFFVGTVSKKTAKTQNFIQFTQNLKIYQMCEKSFSIRIANGEKMTYFF